jgi:hypothetical protein
VAPRIAAWLKELDGAELTREEVELAAAFKRFLRAGAQLLWGSAAAVLAGRVAPACRLRCSGHRHLLLLAPGAQLLSAAACWAPAGHLLGTCCCWAL